MEPLLAIKTLLLYHRSTIAS